MTISRGTKRISMEKVLGEVEARKQTLVSVSQLEDIMNGTIIFVCIAGHKITTNVRTYFSCPPTKATGLKSGCRLCGYKKTKKKKPEDSTLSKTTKVLTGILKNIKDLNSLLQFLKENSNEYNDFMLEQIKIGRRLNTPNYEKHHIFPLHMRGPDEPWNLVSLSFDEHTLAHDYALRFMRILVTLWRLTFEKALILTKLNVWQMHQW